MAVAFYYDYPSWFTCHDPGAAIAVLSEQSPGHRVLHRFIDFYGVFYSGQPLPAYLTLNAADAFLMMGTTAELQNELYSTSQSGLTWISIPNDYLAIWYVRRTTQQTVVSIAPRQGYWGNEGVPYGRNWRNLYPYQVFNGGISLYTLAYEILPQVEGQKGWYL